MPIAHVCPSCGISLTRVRASREPVYGLNLVVCPGCGYAVVRRAGGRHAVQEHFQQLWRLVLVMMRVAAVGSVLILSAEFARTFSQEFAYTLRVASISQVDWICGSLGFVSDNPQISEGLERVRESNFFKNEWGGFDITPFRFVGLFVGAGLIVGILLGIVSSHLRHWWPMWLPLLGTILAVLWLDPVLKAATAASQMNGDFWSALVVSRAAGASPAVIVFMLCAAATAGIGRKAAKRNEDLFFKNWWLRLLRKRRRLRRLT